MNLQVGVLGPCIKHPSVVFNVFLLLHCFLKLAIVLVLLIGLIRCPDTGLGWAGLGPAAFGFRFGCWVALKVGCTKDGPVPSSLQGLAAEHFNGVLRV